MTDIEELYGQSYQQGSVDDKMVEATDAIADVLNISFRPRSVCDVGCGGGSLLRAFVRRGVPSVVGIEGSKAAVEMGASIPVFVPIIHHDLRQPFDKDRLGMPWGGADLTVSTDVGEHIEEEFHSNYCDTLRSIMAPGGALVFGAAGEGQDGLGHVSCRHVCYWISLFEQRGLRLAPASSEILRMDFHKREAHAHAWWWAKNCVVFIERTTLR